VVRRGSSSCWPSSSDEAPPAANRLASVDAPATTSWAVRLYDPHPERPDDPRARPPARRRGPGRAVGRRSALVLGGDCSILLGCLVGARRAVAVASCTSTGTSISSTRAATTRRLLSRLVGTGRAIGARCDDLRPRARSGPGSTEPPKSSPSLRIGYGYAAKLTAARRRPRVRRVVRGR
jgi:hypothetical protein